MPTAFFFAEYRFLFGPYKPSVGYEFCAAKRRSLIPFGPYGNRTRVLALRGPRPSR